MTVEIVGQKENWVLLTSEGNGVEFKGNILIDNYIHFTYTTLKIINLQNIISGSKNFATKLPTENPSFKNEGIVI